MKRPSLLLRGNSLSRNAYLSMFLIYDPLNLNLIDEISFRLGFMIKPVLALDSSIKKAISRFYEGISDNHLLSKSKTGNKPEELNVMEASSSMPISNSPKSYLKRHFMKKTWHCIGDNGRSPCRNPY